MIVREEYEGKVYLKIMVENANDELMFITRYQSVDGLLLMEQHHVDGDCFYRYDVTGMESLQERCERISLSIDEINHLITQISGIMEEAKDWLMREEEFLYQPGTIYYQKDKVYLPWAPGCQMNRNLQMEQVAEFLMKQTNTEDRETALFVYDLYRKCRFHEFQWEIAKEKKSLPETRQPFLEDRPIARRLSIDPVEQPVDESKKWPIFLWVCIGSVLVSAFVAWSGILRSPVTRQWDLMKVLAYCVILIIVIAYAASKTIEMQKTDKTVMSSNDATVVLRHDEVAEGIVLTPLDQRQEGLSIDYFPFYVGKDHEHVNGVLSGEGISRIHGWFQVQGTEISYIDRDSTNGTKLNDRQVVPGEAMRVSPGDVLQFGTSKYRILPMTDNGSTDLYNKDLLPT